jgi:hypothetical protein
MYPESRCQPRQPTGRTNRLCVVVGLRGRPEREQSEHSCGEAQEQCSKNSQIEESGVADFFNFHG